MKANSILEQVLSMTEVDHVQYENPSAENCRRQLVHSVLASSDCFRGQCQVQSTYVGNYILHLLSLPKSNLGLK